MESMLEESKKESESTGETETGPDGKPIETTSGAHNSGYLHEAETDANGNVIAKPTEEPCRKSDGRSRDLHGGIQTGPGSPPGI